MAPRAPDKGGNKEVKPAPNGAVTGIEITTECAIRERKKKRQSFRQMVVTKKF
jgi:hypothetical protein